MWRFMTLALAIADCAGLFQTSPAHGVMIDIAKPT
jgi:hypothetical protein